MNRRAICWAYLCALLLLGAVLGGGCGEDQERPLPEEPAPAPTEGMRGIQLRNFQVGDTEWILHADTASVYREKKRVVAENVRIDFFDGEKHVSQLTADTGVLLQATDDLEARGHVRVVTEDGAVLTTDVLFWDHQRAKIHTDEYVEIQQQGNVLAGYGMEADPGLNRVEILRDVKGTVVREPPHLRKADRDST
ncbi:MAG TPA: LPS export ABC transporter periplasmic protein LptC [bacterium]|nr:LPS export ABC transporter periplasmic protein LptC [bacterium]